MKLLIEIRSYLNTPYVSGGTTHRGVDCSGLVVAVYKTSLGIELPHNSTMLYKKGSRITRNALKFGDLIFFKNRRRSRISHVGIYLKDTKFVHASSSKGVIVSDLVQDEYYKKRYAGACRIKRFN